MNNMSNGIKALEARISILEKADNQRYEDLRLVYEYLGVKKMVFPEMATLVDEDTEDTEDEEDCECCDECGCELTPLDYVFDMIDKLDEEEKKDVKKYLK